MIKQKMKKFSTATLTALVAMCGLLLVVQATPAQAQATPAKPAAKPAAEGVFTANAPDQYTVVKGDTLWGIAGRFLTKPWRWPEIWQMNKSQIKDPHWIYPGQIIILDKVNGTMRLSESTPGKPGDTVTLEPRVREESGRVAISSIPQNIIEPFLTRQLIAETADMIDYPRIIAAKGDRVVLGRGDTAYATGITDPSVQHYQIVRKGIALKDPDTHEILGYQADYLGSATVTRGGDPVTLQITKFSQEINVGDRLYPEEEPHLINYVPHAPDHPVAGRIINTYEQVGLAGRGMVVVLNRGNVDGLDIGTILSVQSSPRVIDDRTNGTPHDITLPSERLGLLFVFRIYEHVSYAMVLNAEMGIEPGDAFTQP